MRGATTSFASSLQVVTTYPGGLRKMPSSDHPWAVRGCPRPTNGDRQ